MYTKILSRHPTHDVLRKNPLLQFPFRTVVRLGSVTEIKNSFIEINTIDSIKNSSNKLLMKQCFDNVNISTAKWYTFKRNDGEYKLYLSGNQNNECILKNISFPIVVKHIFGSRGTGNYLFKTRKDFKIWADSKDNFDNYIIEKFYNYNREYRLHISENGCFYTCRKLLRDDIESEKRWYRNNDNVIWITEENELFDKPLNWNIIELECIKALKSTGLDLGAFDIRIQSKIDKEGNIREFPNFIILEVNSAASFAERTTIEYLKELPKLILNKYKNQSLCAEYGATVENKL